MNLSNRQSDIALRILLLACLLVFLIAWLYPAYWNWAIFNLDLIFPFNFIILGLIAALAIMPFLNRVVYKLLADLLSGFSRSVNGLPPALRLALWIIVPAILLYILKNDSYILGDGHMILSNVVGDKLISPTAPGFSLLVKLIARLFNIASEAQAARLIAGISIVSGVIYLYFLHAILRVLISDTNFRPLMFLALAFSGLIVLFTGYIETYPIMIAWLAVYIYASLRFIRGDFNLAPLIIIFAIGVFWHVWFIAFLPSFLHSLLRRYRLFPGKAIIILSILFICGIYVAGRFLLRSDTPVTIPLIPTQQSAYFIFSPAHLLDILNHIFIVGPIMTIAAILFLIFSARSEISDNIKMLIYAALPSLAIAFICDPVLGAIRDWDLLSIYALPLMLAGTALFWRTAQKTQALLVLIIPVILIGLIHVSGFIINNRNAETALVRAVRILDQDPHYQGNYYDGRRAIPFGTILSNIYNRHDLGVEFTERALASISSGQGYLALANQYYNAQEWEKACRYYGMVPQDVPMSTKNHFTYAQSLFFLKRYDLALKQLGVALKDTVEISICFLMAGCFLEQHKIDSALKYYDLGLSGSSDSAQHLTKIASILYERKIYQAALPYCRRILAIDPRNTKQLVMLGLIHQNLADNDSAFQYFSTALEQDSASYPAATGLANYYYQKADLSRAVEVLQRAEKLNPENPDIPFKIGYIFSVMARGDEAIEAFRRTLRFDSDHLQARHFMAEVFFGMDMPDSALAQWDSALAINSSFLPGYFGQAKVYDKLGNAEMARKSLEICLRLNPQLESDPEARSLLKKYQMGN
jgi:tetratricopeptide (TPR) repeat protein